MIAILKISHFKYDDNLESPGGTRFQANYADNRIRVIDIAVCKAPKAFCHRSSDGRILSGLHRLYSQCLGSVHSSRLYRISVILISGSLLNNMSQIDGKNGELILGLEQ